MVQIINPYGNQKTMGEDLFGLGGLTESFFGPKASTAAYTREKFKEQQRQNEATELVAQGIAQPGYDTGLLAGNAVRAGITPSNLFGMRSGVSISGLDPNALGTPANQGIITQNQLTIPGTAYGSTPLGMESTQRAHAASELAKTDRIVRADELKNARELIQVHAPITPENPLGYATVPRAEFLANPGKYVQVAPSDIYKSAQAGAAFPNWADPNKLAYLGADVKPDSVFNWIAPPETPGGPPRQGTSVDRQTDIITKQPLPVGHQLYAPSSAGGANSMTAAGLGRTQSGNLDESIIAGEDAIGLTGRIKTMVQANPNIVGPAGNALRAGQTVTDVVASMHGLLGGTANIKGDLETARMTVRRTLGDSADKLFPEIFSGDLNKVETLHALLTYKVARALNKGGTLSNMDVDRARNMVGTPDSWFKGPTEFLNRMQATEDELRIELDNNKLRRQTNQASAPGAVPPPTARGATAAPGAAPPPGFVLD